MAKNKKNEILEVVILTLFMLSGILFLANFYLKSLREDALAAARTAGDNYQELAKRQKQDWLVQALAQHKRLNKTGQGTRDLSSEINHRQSISFSDIPRTFPPYTRKSGAFIRHSKKFDVPKKQGRALKFLIDFLGRIESERPDIHVESADFTTSTYKAPEQPGQSRLWSMTCNFVLWEPAEGG